MKPILACLLAPVAVLLHGCKTPCVKDVYDSCVYGEDNANVWTYGGDCEKLKVISSCVEQQCCEHSEGGMVPSPGVTMNEMMNDMGTALKAAEVECQWHNPCPQTTTSAPSGTDGGRWAFTEGWTGSKSDPRGLPVSAVSWRGMHTQGSGAHTANVAQKKRVFLSDWETRLKVCRGWGYLRYTVILLHRERHRERGEVKLKYMKALIFQWFYSPRLMDIAVVQWCLNDGFAMSLQWFRDVPCRFVSRLRDWCLQWSSFRLEWVPK